MMLTQSNIVALRGLNDKVESNSQCLKKTCLHGHILLLQVNKVCLTFVVQSFRVYHYLSFARFGRIVIALHRIFLYNAFTVACWHLEYRSDHEESECVIIILIRKRQGIFGTDPNRVTNFR